MVKVFTTNSDGKIEFTKDELEKVLNEVWRDGYNSNTSYLWSSPITTPYYTTNTNPIKITCDTGEWNWGFIGGKQWILITQIE